VHPVKICEPRASVLGQPRVSEPNRCRGASIAGGHSKAGLNRCVDQLGLGANVWEAGQNAGKGVALGLTVGWYIGISTVASTCIVVHSRRDEAASSDGCTAKKNNQPSLDVQVQFLRQGPAMQSDATPARGGPTWAEIAGSDLGTQTGRVPVAPTANTPAPAAQAPATAAQAPLAAHTVPAAGKNNSRANRAARKASTKSGSAAKRMRSLKHEKKMRDQEQRRTKPKHGKDRTRRPPAQTMRSLERHPRRKAATKPAAADDGDWQEYDYNVWNKARFETEYIDMHEALVRRVKEIHGARMFDLGGDGNCFFRVVARALLGTEAKHGEVRRAAVKEMRDNADVYSVFAAYAGSFEQYLAKMEKNGEFIENETEIQAVCNAYNVTVVLTSHDAGHDKVVEPTGGADAETRTIYVAHYNQLHYVAIAKGGAVMGQAVPDDHGAAPVDGDGDSDSGSDYGGDGDGDSDPDDRGSDFDCGRDGDIDGGVSRSSTGAQT